MADFMFQEFQSSLPLWSWLLLAAATTSLSWWSYRGLSPARGMYKYSLITLRSLTFFILLVLLLNPVFRTENTYYQKSDILLLLDDSESTAVEKGNYRGIETYREVLDRLGLDDSSRVTFTRMAIGADTRPVSPGELTRRADRTNLNSAIGAVLQRQEESGAVILLSDGIYTGGQNPVFDAQKINIPLFSVALGDTASERDLLVSSVSTNETGYLNRNHPVGVTLSARGFANRPFPVQIRRGERILDSRTVTPENDDVTTTLNFELRPGDEGLQQYRVEIPLQEAEWTESNNSRHFSIDVQDAKQRILSLAFEVHPDVRFIRSLLFGGDNTVLTTRTWLKGDRFIEGNLNIDPDTVDLTLIHGFPESGLPSGTEKALSTLLEKTPVVFAALPQFSSRNLHALTSLPLPVDLSPAPDFLPVSLTGAAEPDEHPVMELPAINYDLLPPLSAPVQNVKAVPGAEILFTSQYRGENSGAPLLSIMEPGNRRNAFIAGYGWYRAAQHGNPEVREFTRRLWWNIISWTAADPDNRRLSIQPSKRSYSGSESVILSGFLRNESGDMESDADIDIELSSDTMDTRFYSMDNLGNGRYRLDLEAMPEGIYTFRAAAAKGNRTIGEQSGEFAVARSNVEFINTIRNDKLLRQLSEQTGGEFFTHDSLNGFWNELQERGLLEPQEKTDISLFYPYRHWSWFTLVILFLSSEWILRKYISLP